MVSRSASGGFARQFHASRTHIQIRRTGNLQGGRKGAGSPQRTPALSNDLHSALQKASPALSDGRFSIGKIEPIRDASGTVIAYQVEISH